MTQAMRVDIHIPDNTYQTSKMPLQIKIREEVIRGIKKVAYSRGLSVSNLLESVCISIIKRDSDYQETQVQGQSHL